MATFEVQDEEWLKNAWSVVVTFITEPDHEQRHEVHVRFLAPAGPRDLLNPGARLWLMEGARAVARGMVATALPPPQQ